jgi:asparagine synthetase B (glutamine-hydrolysing)
LVQHHLFEAASSDVRLLLSGAGGDEVLGGRTMPDIAQRLRRSRTISRMPGPMRMMGRRAAKVAGWSDLATAAAHFGLERKIGGSRVFSAEERVLLLRDPALARPGIRASILEPFYQEVSSDPINEILHVWQRGWLSEDVLARADRMAAHHRLQVRFPMLDTEFLEIAAAIPGLQSPTSGGDAGSTQPTTPASTQTRFARTHGHMASRPWCSIHAATPRCLVRSF